ncbi:phage replication protein [Pseudomonas tohonis]|uniref:phage replication protein n=1 Tax=Pseudomonas tohonis TaxID=2725477 RepID=UPI001F1AA881|nr:phage replication protein [Pseudomonas tohonis]
MARARNIKPALFKNEILGVADPLFTLLFEGLWLLADREGRLEDRPMRIKAEVFPYREGLNVDQMLNWLQQSGFIQRYEVSGSRYIQINSFTKHQNPHKNEPASEIPCVSDGCIASDKIGTDTDESGSAPADSLNLIPDSLNLIPSSPSPAPEPVEGEIVLEVQDSKPDLFDQFWAEYPNKTCKAKAKAKWEKLEVNQALFDQIMAGLRLQRASTAWVKDNGQYIPHPTTWLNGERWNDEVRTNVHQFPSRHHGFEERDYTDGLMPRGDGTYDF